MGLGVGQIWALIEAPTGSPQKQRKAMTKLPDLAELTEAETTLVVGWASGLWHKDLSRGLSLLRIPGSWWSQMCCCDRRG